MSGIMATILQPLKIVRNTFHAFSAATPTSTSLVSSEGPLFSSIRTKVRCYFPRPNEVKRVRRHGWQTRMSTPNGRKTIMRRLLKGRFVLTH